MKTTFYALLAVTAPVLLAGCGGGTPPANPALAAGADSSATVTRIVALGRVEPQDKLWPLAAEVGGVVVRLGAKEGQPITQGQVLVELDQTVERADAARAGSAMETQRRTLEVTRADLRSATALDSNAQATLARTEQLARSGAATPQSLDDARTTGRQRQAEVARAQANVRAAEARLLELQAEAARAGATANRRTLRAPASGTLLELSATVGSALQPAQTYGQMAPAGPVTVLCEVDEFLAPQVQVGQSAYIRPQGQEAVLARGKVSYAAAYLKAKSLFARVAGEAEDRRVREVRIVLTEGSDKLLFNARVEAVIEPQTSR